MKINTKLVMIAVGLLVVSAGIVWPIRGNISTLQQEVSGLELQMASDESIPAQVAAMHQRVKDARERSSARSKNLCPDTPQAQQSVEKMVLAHVMDSGLMSVRTDSGSTVRTGKFPYRTFDLVVEGDAQALMNFFRALESMPWVTRVLKVGVEQGEATRRITLEIALMLEVES